MNASIEAKEGKTNMFSPEVAFLLKINEILIQETIDPESLLKMFLEATCTMTRWEVGHIFWLDRQEETKLKPSQIWFFGSQKQHEAFFSFKEATEKSHFQIGEGLPGKVYAQKKPIWLTDIFEGNVFQRTEALKSTSIVSAFAVPVFRRKKIYAVAEFFSSQKIDTQQACLKLIEGAIHSISVFLDQEKTSRELKAEVKKARKLHQNLQKSFLKSIQLLDKIAAIHNPGIGAHGKRVRRLGGEIARKLSWSGKKLFEFEVACLLHDIGKIGIPVALLEKSTEDMNPAEKKQYMEHVLIGEQISKEISYLEKTPKLIRHHHEYFDGTGEPDHLKGESIPIECRLLTVVDAFDERILEDHDHYGPENTSQAVEYLTEHSGSFFDPKLVEVLLSHLELQGKEEMEITAHELKAGMKLSRNLMSSEGMVLVAKDMEIQPGFILKIQNWLEKEPISRLIYVYRAGMEKKKEEAEEPVKEPEKASLDKKEEEKKK